MTAAAADRSSPASTVTALYLRTRALHVEAERTGVIRDILRGEASREGYILLLRNLHPAYLAMEQGLERHRGSPHLGQLVAYRFDRAAAIEADLVSLCGARWNRHVPLLAAGERYAGRIAQASEGDGARLIAHAYTRYLGDLSGGQILQRLLARSLQLQPLELSFYEFPRFSDLEALKMDYRQALDRAGASFPDGDAIVEEGALAFAHNIALSCGVRAAVTLGSATAE
jgi:heme oxygenase (biliverdin-producing, ferredoxin)